MRGFIEVKGPDCICFRMSSLNDVTKFRKKHLRQITRIAPFLSCIIDCKSNFQFTFIIISAVRLSLSFFSSLSIGVTVNEG